MNVVEIIMLAGKTAVNIALYTMLPMMIVVLCIMKLLENSGILGRMINLIAPLVRPLGLTGLSTIALLQINFINFAAPLATLALMERQQVSDRHVAATLAMLLAMAQGNILYPVYALGLAWTPALGISISGGLVASAATWYLFARQLSGVGNLTASATSSPHQNSQGIIAVISTSGAEAMKLAASTVPMLTLTVALYSMLDEWGAVQHLEKLMTPALASSGISGAFVGLALAKYLGGGTACYSVMADLVHNGVLTVNEINRSAGFLINSFDLPGIGIFLGISGRFPRLMRFAIPGALTGIAFRTFLHVFV